VIRRAHALCPPYHRPHHRRSCHLDRGGARSDRAARRAARRPEEGIPPGRRADRRRQMADRHRRMARRGRQRGSDRRAVAALRPGCDQSRHRGCQGPCHRRTACRRGTCRHRCLAMAPSACRQAGSVLLPQPRVRHVASARA
jgi:hypothetical protein